LATSRSCSCWGERPWLEAPSLSSRIVAKYAGTSTRPDARASVKDMVSVTLPVQMTRAQGVIQQHKAHGWWSRWLRFHRGEYGDGVRVAPAVHWSFSAAPTRPRSPPQDMGHRGRFQWGPPGKTLKWERSCKGEGREGGSRSQAPARKAHCRDALTSQGWSSSQSARTNHTGTQPNFHAARAAAEHAFQCRNWGQKRGSTGTNTHTTANPIPPPPPSPGTCRAVRL
jgi:hypothetical protein